MKAAPNEIPGNFQNPLHMILKCIHAVLLDFPTPWLLRHATSAYLCHALYGNPRCRSSPCCHCYRTWWGRSKEPKKTEMLQNSVFFKKLNLYTVANSQPTTLKEISGVEAILSNHIMKSLGHCPHSLVDICIFQTAAAFEASISFYHFAADAWKVRAPNWRWLGVLYSTLISGTR